jgi:hypothetical protein
VVYLLVFEGELLDRSTPEIKLGGMLASRLSETLPIPILDLWSVTLWEAGAKKELIGDLAASGDCPSGHWVHVPESGWKEVITALVEQGEISIR